MTWFYALNGRQQGPVSDEQLQALAQARTIDGNTLVWREGMKDWQPLRAVRVGDTPGVAGASAVAVPGQGVCAECGQVFPLDDLIQLNQSHICARCKPIFLQKIQEGVATTSARVWRDGNRLVAVAGTVLPDRCIKCNAPAHGYRLKRTLFWHNPLYYFLLLCYLVVYVVVAIFVQRKAVLHLGLCGEHRDRRNKGMLIGWSGCALGALLLVAGAGFQSGWAALAGVIVGIGGGIAGYILAYSVRAVKITREHVFLTGCHRDFLAELPDWPGV